MNRLHQRGSSAGIDNRAFREAIAKMRNDVLDSKAETQRVRDQLNCLIMLVKRAWTGDSAAAVHVSNIVGVPPPAFKTEGEEEEEHYKNAPVHHWAMLTIGLLNRHYQQMEAEGLALARARLQHRQEFLDEQLQCHREMLLKEKRALKKRLASAPPKSYDQLFHPAQSRPRDSSNSERVAHPGTLVEFLYPGTKIDKQKPSKQNRQTGRRFSQPGLFESEGIVEKPKRPVSAIHQQRTDAQRSRPKSAVKSVNVKGERPLKYETTRPISAKNISTTFLTNPTNPNLPNATRDGKKPRAKSARAYLGISSGDAFYQGEAAGSHPAPTPVRDHEAEDMGHVSPFRDGVSEDLRKIELMEEDFRKTASLLQQKLGISNCGAI
ncbi:uncharacterized protein [Diadema setosum]|uniref:uncharacterized protein isoform X2 n=1 Tax=Diadema setosum TaxID=31175 RepID=UPI003B3A4A88